MKNFVVHDPWFKRPVLLPFIKDIHDMRNKIGAIIHRFGCKMPRFCGLVTSDFVLFYRLLIQRLFIPLVDADIPSLIEWLEGCSYSLSRKDQLAKLRKLTAVLRTSGSKCHIDSESFLKTETYDKPKHARAINSYTDLLKTFFGPLFHAMDEKTFMATPNGQAKDPLDPGRFFIKHTNPREWPKMLESYFGRLGVMGTDFTSFEAHHMKVLAGVVIYWMCHMVRTTSLSGPYKRLLSRLVLGCNKTKFDGIAATVDQRLMSGAMWTSSANGVLNLCIMSYLVSRSQNANHTPQQLVDWVMTDFKGKVEGDDGLCATAPVDDRLVKGLGLKLKFDYFPDYTKASFCGVVCDPVSMTVVKDPVKFLRGYFFVPWKFRESRKLSNAYLKAKSLSLKYNYNNSPVIGPLAHRVTQILSSVDPRCISTELDSWERKVLADALSEKVWMRSPCVSVDSMITVAQVFGFSLESQVATHKAILAWDGSRPLEINLREYEKHYDFRNMLNYTNTDPDLRRFVDPLIERTYHEGLVGESSAYCKSMGKLPDFYIGSA